MFLVFLKMHQTQFRLPGLLAMYLDVKVFSGKSLQVNLSHRIFLLTKQSKTREICGNLID